MNPLLDFSGLPRFDAVQPEHVTPAVRQLLDENRALIERLVAPATAAGWDVTSIISVGDAADNGYKMVGIPDGLGAYDNGNGTFTVLMNHEIGTGSGINRAHGANGAFVSEWIINKSDFKVLAGADLATSHFNLLQIFAREAEFLRDLARAGGHPG